MGYKFNPFTANLDVVNEDSNAIDYGVKYNYMLSVLSAYDRIANVSWLDVGETSQRINQVTYESDLYPDSEIVKNVFWIDPGTMNQRIDKIEYIGTVFNPDSLRKVFSYALTGNTYYLNGYYYELF